MRKKNPKKNTKKIPKKTTSKALLKGKKAVKIKKTTKSKKAWISFGQLSPESGRILVLAVSIILVSTIVLMQKMLNASQASMEVESVQVVHKSTPLEKAIKSLVQGYPIEQMVPYITKQDPKVAAFMIAIAKKESAWGKHHPVLAGQDCYNYWGFRLKSERMGSGGHTCFDSPQQAVQVVASRLDELVNEENIDSPKDMIVWKCGYGCQDETKTASEAKWISDVNMYYRKFSDYL